MAHLFVQNSLCDDVLNGISFPKSGLSPTRKDFEMEDDLIEPFKSVHEIHNHSMYGQPSDLLWNPSH